jgi:NADH-quinone oxidoreductase subunit D
MTDVRTDRATTDRDVAPAGASESDIANYTINFGPQHPAAHGVLRLVLELDGEIVERVDPHVGLLHRGTEKLCEYKTYLQACLISTGSITSRRCARSTASSSPSRSCSARGAAARAISARLFAELTRISNHFLNLGSHIMDVGAMTPNCGCSSCARI